LALALLLAVFPLRPQSAGRLRIYAIDVEGGKSTLYVSPSGESMLVDTGYAGNASRDARRIVAAARAAGIRQIDYLVITHYHADHAGGVAQLAAAFPVRAFYDHGDNYQGDPKSAPVFKAYRAVRARHPHTVLQAGDFVPVKGIRVQIVAASGRAIAATLPGAGQPNPLCASYRPIAADPGENPRSLALLITFGQFRVADFGDLYWNQEHSLACPADKIGAVDLYMTTHHGKKTSGSPQLVHALHPRAAVLNNGPSSGGSAEALQTLRSSPGFLDLWQLHFSTAAGPSLNSAEAFIANPADPCSGYWIEVSAAADASFTVANRRNQYARSYPSPASAAPAASSASLAGRP
jgi:beta-lactamase superfamily II metal-dependent hydrolase